MGSLLGYTEVLLASGDRVRGVLPTPNELARLGLLPEHLARVAYALGDPKYLTTEQQEPDFRERLAAYLLNLASSFPRERWDEAVDAWVPYRMTPEDVERIGDANVRDQLEDLVLRVATAREVSARSALILGLTDAADPEPSEVAPGVTGYVGFRGGPDGAPGGADGGPLGAPPVGAARGGRSSRRVRAGRGAGDPAGAGGARGAGPGGPEAGAG